MKLVWVAGLSQTYTIGETSYGPSEGSVQIPAQLAGALGLEIVSAPDGEADAAPGESPDAQALREARADLEGARQEVANLTTQLAEMREAGGRALNAVQQVGQLFGDSITPGTELTEGHPSVIAQRVQNVIGAAKTNADEYSKYLGISQELTTERDQIRTEADQLAARVVELEAKLAEAQKPAVIDPPADPPAKPGKK